MTSTAIESLGRAGADGVRSAYRTEAHIWRAAPAQVQPYARIHAARQLTLAPAPPEVPVSVRRDEPVDALRDHYTAHCLSNAIQAFHEQQARLDARSVEANKAQRDEQTRLQSRADAANDLGTIQGLLPLQPYRYAVGVPPILPQQIAAAAGVGKAAIDPVAQAAILRSTTEDAVGADPTTRARIRNPRKAGA